MKQQFVETIKIKDGKVVNLSCHQVRMERTINHFFPDLAQRAMPCLKEPIKPRKDMDFVKARVVYGMEGVELIEYIPYSIRNIKSLQIVYNDTIEYEYKSTDRSALNKLVADKGACDEIIIVKNGYITDTSFTNLAIFDSGEWITPKRPLLYGTKRASLLDKRLIKEADITLDVLRKACKVRLFNAMIEFGEIEIDVKHITMW